MTAGRARARRRAPVGSAAAAAGARPAAAGAMAGCAAATAKAGTAGTGSSAVASGSASAAISTTTQGSPARSSGGHSRPFTLPAAGAPTYVVSAARASDAAHLGGMRHTVLFTLRLFSESST